MVVQDRHPRTVPGPQRRAVLFSFTVLAGIWAGLVGLLIAAGELVVHSAAVTHFDDHVTRAVVNSRTAALNSVMKSVTWLGSWVALLVAAIVVAVFAWAGEAGGVRIGKTVVSRHRPPQAIWVVTAHGWSFPSGHTAAACLAFAVLALCVATPVRPLVARILCWLIAGLAIAATAFSRVELGVHWTTDVIASVLFMAGWLTAIAVVLGGRLRRPESVLDQPGAPAASR